MSNKNNAKNKNRDNMDNMSNKNSGNNGNSNNGNSKKENVDINNNDGNKENDVFTRTPSTIEQNGLPENCSEMVNFFGTYNIQQTDNASNTYPAIGEGLAEEEAEKLIEESERWKNNE